MVVQKITLIISKIIITFPLLQKSATFFWYVSIDSTSPAPGSEASSFRRSFGYVRHITDMFAVSGIDIKAESEGGKKTTNVKPGILHETIT